ncbi:tubulin alpha-2 chain isoform X2 [Halyomorpha halys]|uniref:tubulin alpha-2 chain isoform X2 n=1 Tax=Halyomorpha halys TaxID=286706 RepID=UPI0006D4C718|nr:tubulin alpha-4 chain-like isoform X2 [Halyomorpha halys]
MREVVSVHVGQAGVQLGNALWEAYCLEHRVAPDGILEERSDRASDGFSSFFQQLNDRRCVPIGVLTDLEPTVVDEVRNGPSRSLFSAWQMVTGKEDAANNFARGACSIGLDVVGHVTDSIRQILESCDSFQGFMVFHSVGGGTGSGFTAFILDDMLEEHGKKCKLEVAIYPAPEISTVVVEPYNAVFFTHATLDHFNVSFIADNEALYKICKHNLDIDLPAYKNINRLVAQAISTITSSIRFGGPLNVDLQEFQTNLVPYPKIHFPLMAYAPVTSARNASHEALTVMSMTRSCFDPHSHMLNVSSTALSKGEGSFPQDSALGQYIACCLLYRGNVVPKEVNAAISFIKNNRSIKFVSWSPTGFKVGINQQKPIAVPNGDLAEVDKCVCLLANTTSVTRTWTVLNRKYDLMFDKRAFVHWYQAEGMEISEMEDARECLAVLERDYYELMTPMEPMGDR